MLSDQLKEVYESGAVKETRLPDQDARIFFICDQCGNSIPCHSYEVHGSDRKSREFEASCARCGHKVHGWKSKSMARSMAFSFSALTLYIPALMFPFMTMEVNGIKSTSTIWQGVMTLTESGSYFVAGIVLLASIVIPVVKLLILFYLSFSASHGTHNKIKLALYHFVESIGRWSMLDIFLLAVMVAIIKISPWALVYPEKGSFLFALVVIFTMLASASFDPRLMWKDEDVKKVEL